MNLEEQLYEFLKHGDEEHQEWLREAIYAFFENKPRPLPKAQFDIAEETLVFLSIMKYWLNRDMGTRRQDNTVLQIKNLAEELRQKIVASTKEIQQSSSS